MYAGVPMTLPVCVSRVIWLVFEMPKSATFTAPARVTMTFCGLTSRWTMPRSCAQPSPFSVSAATKSASSGGSFRRLSRTVRRVPPSISSIERKSSVPSPNSKSSRTFGCFSCEWSLTSWTNRLRNSGSSATSGRIRFSATCRPERVSTAA